MKDLSGLVSRFRLWLWSGRPWCELLVKKNRGPSDKSILFFLGGGVLDRFH